MREVLCDGYLCESKEAIPRIKKEKRKRKEKRRKRRKKEKKKVCLDVMKGITWIFKKKKKKEKVKKKIS